MSAANDATDLTGCCDGGTGQGGSLRSRCRGSPESKQWSPPWPAAASVRRYPPSRRRAASRARARSVGRSVDAAGCGRARCWCGARRVDVSGSAFGRRTVASVVSVECGSVFRRGSRRESGSAVVRSPHGRRAGACSDAGRPARERAPYRVAGDATPARDYPRCAPPRSRENRCSGSATRWRACSRISCSLCSGCGSHGWSSLGRDAQPGGQGVADRGATRRR